MGYLNSSFSMIHSGAVFHTLSAQLRRGVRKFTFVCALIVVKGMIYVENMTYTAIFSRDEVEVQMDRIVTGKVSIVVYRCLQMCILMILVLNS